jgi:hypothetical protein
MSVPVRLVIGLLKARNFQATPKKTIPDLTDTVSNKAIDPVWFLIYEKMDFQRSREIYVGSGFQTRIVYQPPLGRG